MPGERQDYLLRLIEQLRQFVAQALALRQAGKLDEALMALAHAQEKLFVRPAAEFRHLPIVDQLRLLTLGESPAAGRDKCVAYATILEQAGLVFPQVSLASTDNTSGSPSASAQVMAWSYSVYCSTLAGAEV